MPEKLRTLGWLEAGVLAATLVAGAGCTSTSTSTNVSALPADVKAITFLQRPRIDADGNMFTDQGNVFDYTTYHPGGRMVTLSPPSADGKLTPLFPTTDACTALLGASASTDDVNTCVARSDIMSYDLSFDATSVVFSARIPGESNFQIFSMNLDGTNLQQLTTGGQDYVYPIYLPGQKILFMTNRNVEADADPSSQQFHDEYERATTAQVGIMNVDGNGMTLGPRNVSHRVAPSLLPSGQVMYTEWMHMGPVNEGHLRLMNTDMTGMKEAFGDELGSGNASANSYLKARYVSTGSFNDPAAGPLPDYQVVAIATSRDRTLQAGQLMLIDLNGSEANSASVNMTPLVPADRTPSPQGIGRYYDAEALGDEAPGQFLATWSDGPVESEELSMAMSTPDFGIYLFDAKNAGGVTGGRSPIFNDPAYWDILPRPVRTRMEPPDTATGLDNASTASTTIGVLDVYNSSLFSVPDGSIVKARFMEGFSNEEGGVDMFGTTDFDGQSRYGEIPIQSDHSVAAQVPANVPFHIQLIDKFGMAAPVNGAHGTASSTPVANEDIWFSGRAGESRFCGGCHENRTAAKAIMPGVQASVLAGAVNLDVPRPQRVSLAAATLDASGNLPAGNITGDVGVRGVPWDLAVQPILDAKCASCHNGDASKSYNPSYTVTDMTTGTYQTFVFDLRGQKLNVTVGERMTGDYTASYLSLMGLGEILGDDVVSITGTPPNYVVAGAAEASPLMMLLNPPQRFPADASVRMFGTAAFSMNVGGTMMNFPGTPHPTDIPGNAELTPDEYYLLGLNIDMGGQFYFRENLPQ
ncbi:MAG TPA: hypothetical protein VMT03_15915 [Polyangia bacterium]|nr:hypothetical protein [Polyangia bacterium]